MVEESSPVLPPAEESIEAETDAALEPEAESGEPATEPASEPPFVCDCEELMRSACEGLPFYKEHEGKRYCVLHYPSKEKSADFKAALDSKLNKKDFDFRGVWFPDKLDFRGFEFSANADFTSATFSADADFNGAKFKAVVYFVSATFKGAIEFGGAQFAAAQFSYAEFCRAARFINATFRLVAYFTSATFGADADFSFASFSAVAHFASATFSAVANFYSVTFSAAAYFTSATFRADANFDHSVLHTQVDFSSASFNDSIHFLGRATEKRLTDGFNLAAMALGEDPSLNFKHAKIEHPERMAFHTLSLRPHWFVNVDPRRFVFTDVGWEWDRISIKREIAALGGNEASSPNRLLADACRQLAERAEASNRYEEASRFRYWAMDLARRTKWKGWAFWKTDWLHMLYWAVSGYGERILRALGVLAVVWIVFAVLYTQVGFKPETTNTSTEPTTTIAAEDSPREFSRALTYSLAVMSLQKPDPKPLTGTAQTLVLLETILGPVQAALLALAIRRKFMR